MTADEIVQAVKRSRPYSGDEIKLQSLLAGVLPPGFEKEKSLTKGDRIDFYYPDGRVGIEVKVAGTQSAVISQLIRYVSTDLLDELVVLSTKAFSLFPTHLIVKGRLVKVVFHQLVCF